MKGSMVAVAACLVAVFLTSAVRADDAEDVKAAYARHIMLSRTGQAGPFVDLGRRTGTDRSDQVWDICSVFGAPCG